MQKLTNQVDESDTENIKIGDVVMFKDEATANLGPGLVIEGPVMIATSTDTISMTFTAPAVKVRWTKKAEQSWVGIKWLTRLI